MFKVMFENWNNSVITVFEGTFEECVKHGKKVLNEWVEDPFEESLFVVNQKNEKVHFFELFD